MERILSLSRQFVLAGFFMVLWKGVLLWLASCGIRLDEWVAALLNIAASPTNLEALAWIIAGALGIVAVVVWEVVDATGSLKRKFGTSKPPRQHKKPTQSSDGYRPAKVPEVLLPQVMAQAGDEDKLVGRVRFLWDAEEGKSTIIERNGLRSIAIERTQSYLFWPPPIDVKLATKSADGPFDVHVENCGMPLALGSITPIVTENNANFVTIFIGQIYESREIDVKLYKRSAD